jgi:hypothetical protein
MVDPAISAERWLMRERQRGVGLLVAYLSSLSPNALMCRPPLVIRDKSPLAPDA